MRKARFAEWLLRSVTTEERAASTAGDLVESAPERGEWWFWRSLLGTLVSQMWQGVASNPRTMFGLAIRSYLVLLFYAFAWSIAVMFAGWYLLIHAARAYGASGSVMSLSPVTHAGNCFITFMMGRCIARRAPGNELSAVTALCLLQLAVTSVVISVQTASVVGWRPDYLNIALWFLNMTLCFLGALTEAAKRPSGAGDAHA